MPPVFRWTFFTWLTFAALLSGCNQSFSSRVSVTQSLQFSTLTTGASAMQLVLVHNYGTHTVHLQSVRVTGNHSDKFTLNNQCGASLSAGEGCSVGVTFASTTAGTFEGELDVETNSASTPMPSTYLVGTATIPTPQSSYSASAIDFGSLATHATTSQSITLSNNGTAALALGSVSISGTNASLFSESTTCGTALAVGSSCTFTVSFSPQSAGSYLAALNVPSNDSTAPQSIALTAIVLAPKVSTSSSSLDFGSQATHGSSSKTMTLTNSGAGQLALGTISITGTNANFFSDSTTCGTALAVGASCSITVGFTPLVPGTYSATLNVPSDDASSAQSYPLTATSTASTIPSTPPRPPTGRYRMVCFRSTSTAPTAAFRA